MLRDIDSADRAFLLRALTGTMSAGSIMGAAAGYYLREARQWPGWIVLGGIAAGLAVGAVAGWLAYWAAGRSSQGLIQLLTAAGNLPAAPSYSFEESLIARGRYQEAAESFERHLADCPDDHEARLALAALLARYLGRPADAVALYQAVRRQGGAGFDFRASQRLIDLHASTGDRGRHLAELARFADRFRETPAGRAAKTAVARFKADRER